MPPFQGKPSLTAAAVAPGLTSTLLQWERNDTYKTASAQSLDLPAWGTKEHP